MSTYTNQFKIIWNNFDTFLKLSRKWNLFTVGLN